MDDMSAFERQVERRIRRFVGPARPVDDLAIYEAVIGAGRSHGWGSTLLSALRFVVAGVIVALFGGFLLSGALTPQRGEEALPAAAASPSASPTTSSGSVTLTVTDLVGKVGLEVAANLLPKDREWGPNFLESTIHHSPATVTASSVLEPGRYWLVVYAGKPPCEVRLAPVCLGSEPGSQVPQFECWTEFDLGPGEVVDVRITGLPRFESGADVLPACPVASLLRPGS